MPARQGPCRSIQSASPPDGAHAHAHTGAHTHHSTSFWGAAGVVQRRPTTRQRLCWVVAGSGGEAKQARVTGRELATGSRAGRAGCAPPARARWWRGVAGSRSAPRRRRGRARAAGAHLGRPKAWLRSSFNWLKKLIAARRLRRRCVRSCPDPHRGESTYCAG